MTDASSSQRQAPLRLFVAVDVPAPVRRAVHRAVLPLRTAAPDLRWTDPALWHLTLAFLGAVPAEEVAAVVDVVEHRATQAQPFALSLTGAAGSFPGVLWAGICATPELDALAVALRARLAGLGHSFDRPFRAHLTLARTRRRGASLGRLAVAYRGPRSSWIVDRLTLWRSSLGGGPAHHDVVAQRRFADTTPPT